MRRGASAAADEVAARRRRPLCPGAQVLADHGGDGRHRGRHLGREPVRPRPHVADLHRVHDDFGVRAREARVGDEVRHAHAVDVVGAQVGDAGLVGVEAEDLSGLGALVGRVERVDDDDRARGAEVPDQAEARGLADDGVESGPEGAGHVAADAGGDRAAMLRRQVVTGLGKQLPDDGDAHAVVAHERVADADDGEAAAGLRPAAARVFGSRRPAQPPLPAAVCAASSAAAALAARRSSCRRSRTSTHSMRTGWPSFQKNISGSSHGASMATM